MNLYLSAIGFSDMDSMKESRFIKAAVRQCIDEGYILKNESLKRVGRDIYFWKIRRKEVRI